MFLTQNARSIPPQLSPMATLVYRTMCKKEEVELFANNLVPNAACDGSAIVDEEQILARYRGIDSLLSFKADSHLRWGGERGSFEDARPAQFRDVNPDRRPWNRSSLSGRRLPGNPEPDYGIAMENRRGAFCRLPLEGDSGWSTCLP